MSSALRAPRKELPEEARAREEPLSAIDLLEEAGPIPAPQPRLKATRRGRRPNVEPDRKDGN